MIKIGFQV